MRAGERDALVAARLGVMLEIDLVERLLGADDGNLDRGDLCRIDFRRRLGFAVEDVDHHEVLVGFHGKLGMVFIVPPLGERSAVRTFGRVIMFFVCGLVLGLGDLSLFVVAARQRHEHKHRRETQARSHANHPQGAKHEILLFENK
jgi:hypothetical protein